MVNKKISIIIVCYNSSNTIGRLLNSIVKNKESVGDVTIVENNSPEELETRKICNKYQKKLSLNYLKSSNAGFGIGCNIGERHAKNNNLLFLNPDTELQKNSLKILLEHKENNHADIIGGKAVNYEGKVHGSVVRLPNLFIGLFEFSNLGKLFRINKAHSQFYYEDKNILKSKKDQIIDAVSGAYLLISKNTFHKLGKFDENIFMYLEDVDLAKRAKEMGLKIIFCPHSVIWHIGGASSKNKYKIRHQAWFDSRKYYYRKHFGVLTNLIIQPIYEVEEFLLKKLKNI